MRIGPGFGDIQQKFLFRLQSKGEDLASKEAVDKEKENAVKDAFEDLGIGWKLLNWCSKIVTWSSVGYFERRIANAWDGAQSQFLKEAPEKLRKLHDGVVKLLEEEPNRPVTEDLVNRLRNGPLKDTANFTQADYIRIGALPEDSIKTIAGPLVGLPKQTVPASAALPVIQEERPVDQVRAELATLRVPERDVQRGIAIRDLGNTARLLKQKVPDLLKTAREKAEPLRQAVPVTWLPKKVLSEKLKEADDVLALFKNETLDDVAKGERKARAIALLGGSEALLQLEDKVLQEQVAGLYEKGRDLLEILEVAEELETCLLPDAAEQDAYNAVGRASLSLQTPSPEELISLVEWEQHLGTQAFQGHLEAMITRPRLEYLGFSENDIARVLLSRLPEHEQIQKILEAHPELVDRTEGLLRGDVALSKPLSVLEKKELREIQGLLKSKNDAKVLDGIARWCAYFEETGDEIMTVPLSAVLTDNALEANFPRHEVARLEKLQYALTSMDSADIDLLLEKLQEGFGSDSAEHANIQELRDADTGITNLTELMPRLLGKIPPGTLANKLDLAVKAVAKERPEWAALFAEVESLQSILGSMGPVHTQEVLSQLQTSFAGNDIYCGHIEELQDLNTGISTPAAILPQLLRSIPAKELVDKLGKIQQVQDARARQQKAWASLRPPTFENSPVREAEVVTKELKQLGLSREQVDQAVANSLEQGVKDRLIFARAQEILPLSRTPIEELSGQLVTAREQFDKYEKLKNDLASQDLRVRSPALGQARLDADLKGPMSGIDQVRQSVDRKFAEVEKQLAAHALAKMGNSQPLEANEQRAVQPYLKQAEASAGTIVRTFLGPERFLKSLNYAFSKEGRTYLADYDEHLLHDNKGLSLEEQKKKGNEIAQQLGCKPPNCALSKLLPALLEQKSAAELAALLNPLEQQPLTGGGSGRSSPVMGNVGQLQQGSPTQSSQQLPASPSLSRLQQQQVSSARLPSLGLLSGRLGDRVERLGMPVQVLVRDIRKSGLLAGDTKTRFEVFMVRKQLEKARSFVKSSSAEASQIDGLLKGLNPEAINKATAFLSGFFKANTSFKERITLQDVKAFFGEEEYEKLLQGVFVGIDFDRFQGCAGIIDQPIPPAQQQEFIGLVAAKLPSPMAEALQAAGQEGVPLSQRLLKKFSVQEVSRALEEGVGPQLAVNQAEAILGKGLAPFFKRISEGGQPENDKEREFLKKIDMDAVVAALPKAFITTDATKPLQEQQKGKTESFKQKQTQWLLSSLEKTISVGGRYSKEDPRSILRLIRSEFPALAGKDFDAWQTRFLESYVADASEDSTAIVVGRAVITAMSDEDQDAYFEHVIAENSLTPSEFDSLLTEMGQKPGGMTLLEKTCFAHELLMPTTQLLDAYRSLTPADQKVVQDVFAKPYLVQTKSEAVKAFFQAMIALQEKEGPKALHVWQNQCLSEIGSPSWTKRLGQEAEVPEGFSEKSAPDRFWTQFGGTLLQKEPAASRKKLGVYLAQDLLLVKRYNSVTLGSTDLQTLDSLAKLIRTLDSLSTEEKNQIREMMRTPPTEQQLFSPIGKKLGDLYVAARESVLGFTEEQKATGSAGKITNTPLTSKQITSLFGEDADIVEGIKKDQLGIEQALQGGRERCYKTLTPQFAGKIEEKFQGTKDQVRNASFPNETGKSVRGVTDIPELPTVLSTQDYGRSKTPIIIEIEGGEPFELPRGFQTAGELSRGFQTAGKSKDENFAEFLHFLKKQNLSPEVFARVVWSMEQTFRAIFQDTFTEQLRGETHFDVAAVPREAGNKFIIKNDGSVDIIYAHHFQATYADRAKTSRYAFEGGIEPANKNFVQVSVTPGGQGGASFADFKVLAADSSQATKFSDEIDKMMASPAMEEVDSEADQLAIAVIETSSTLVRDRGQEAPQVLAHVMKGFSKTQGHTYRFQGLQGKLEARLCRLKESRREALLEKNNAMENLFFLTGVSKEKQEEQLSAEGAKDLYAGAKEKPEWKKVLAQHKILSEKDEEIRKYEQALQDFQAEATQAQAATTLEEFAKLPSVNSAYKLLGIPEGQEPFTLEELVGAIPDAELKIVESGLGEISSSIKPSVEKSQTQEQVGVATMVRLKQCGITDQQILPYIKSKVLLKKVSVEFDKLHGQKTPEEQMQELRKFKGEDAVSRSFVALGVVADIKEQYDALGEKGQEQLKDFISGRALTEDDRGTPAWKAFNEIQKRVKGSDIWDSRGNSKIVISTDEGLSAVIKKARDIDFAGQMVGLVLGDACVEAAEQMQGKLESVYKERKASLVEAVPMIKGVEPALVEQVPSIVFSEYSREGQPLFLEMGDKKLPFEKGFNGDEDGNFELLGQFFDFFKNDPNLLSRLSLCLVQYIPNLLGNPVPEEIQKEIDMTGWCATEAEITGKRIVMDPTGGSVAVFYQGKVFAKDSMTRQKLATQEGVLKISLKKDGEGNWGYDKVEVFGTDSDDYQVLAGLVAQATQESASVEGSDMFAGLQARQQELVPEFNNDFLTGEAIETATIGDLTVPGNLEEIQSWNMPISLEGGGALLLPQGFQGKKEAVESFCDALQKTLPKAQIEHIFYALGSFPEEILLDPMPVIEDSPPSLERESVRIVPEEGGVAVYALYRPTIGDEPRDPVLTKMTISGEGADCKFTNWEIISNEGEDANLYAQMPKPIVKE